MALDLSSLSAPEQLSMSTGSPAALASLALVNRMYQRLIYRRHEIQRLESYYEGRQPLKFASAEWRKFHADRYGEFSDNWCGVIADAPSDRTAVVGFELPDTEGVLSAEERQLWTDWSVNDMDAQQSQGFLTTRIARRSFISTWGDPDGNPVHTWDHPLFCEIEYDDENPRIRKASLRTWRDDTHEYATLTTAAYVWKWIRKASRDNISGRPKTELDRWTMGGWGWTAREIPGEVWPADNPIGVVPMVEVMNRPMLRGEPLTDIGGVAAMQDAINLLWAYLFTAADFASMPARVVLGMEPPKIPILDKDTGEVVGEQNIKIDDLARGRMLFLTGQGGSIAQWDAAKLDVFTDVMGVAVSHIAAQTRTPGHYLALGTTSNLSADALRMNEVGLSQKVRETHLYCTAPIRETFRLSALVRGNPGVAEAARSGHVAWRDPEIRSDAQLADAFGKDITAGWPFEWLAQHRRGLSPEEIADVMAMKEREAARGLAAIQDAAASFTTSSFAETGTLPNIDQQ